MKKVPCLVSADRPELGYVVIEVDNAIAPPALTDRVRKPRRKKRAIMAPRPIRRAMELYSAAYLKVYGVPPEWRWDGVYVRIVGITNGVTLKRVREMTNQLNWRAG
jgi:hypothetical protein